MPKTKIVSTEVRLQNNVFKPEYNKEKEQSTTDFLPTLLVAAGLTINDNNGYFLSHHQKMSNDGQKILYLCQTGQN